VRPAGTPILLQQCTAIGLSNAGLRAGETGITGAEAGATAAMQPFNPTEATD
jgi:hypothetical protein